MPDTFTHIALPTIARRWIKRPLSMPLVLIGTVLPDYFREIFGLLMPDLYGAATMIFHTPIGVVFSSMLVAAFFDQRQRSTVWVSVIGGQLIHLLFDFIQGYLCGGSLYWLFPYFKPFHLGLFPVTGWPYVFAVSMTLFVLYIGYSVWRNGGFHRVKRHR
ncbi:MAG: hypothetical protein GF313_06025 [Caldithrix sp.]|nr:hypothetical protein [Caldithrix sp.]